MERIFRIIEKKQGTFLALQQYDVASRNSTGRVLLEIVFFIYIFNYMYPFLQKKKIIFTHFKGTLIKFYNRTFCVGIRYRYF